MYKSLAFCEFNGVICEYSAAHLDHLSIASSLYCTLLHIAFSLVEKVTPIFSERFVLEQDTKSLRISLSDLLSHM